MTEPFAARLRAAGLSEAACAQKLDLLARVHAALQAVEPPPARGAREGALYVPGRIEVLGKHTDYAGGRSLVCACERSFVARWRARADGTVRVVDVVNGATLVVPPPGEDGGEARGPGGATYVHAAVRRLRRHFPDVATGVDLALGSDLPRAAGLSSSSALVVTVALAVIEAGGLREQPLWRHHIAGPEDLAAYLATIENGHGFGTLPGDHGVGTFGGSEDHVAILTSVAGTLGQWRFCPPRLERTVALPRDLAFVVAASGVAAEKTGAALQEYNRASALAADLVATWNRVTGRRDRTLAEALDASPEARREMWAIVAAVVDDAALRAALLARLDQFAEESAEIVPAGAAALARGDTATFGVFVLRSHLAGVRGLANLVPETAALTDLAREAGALAASPFGAGFGGSVWALVEAAQAARVAAGWRDRYVQAFPGRAAAAHFFVTGAGPGVVLSQPGERTP